ncbi:MAG: hypothetical protein KBS56_02725 [Clostridiales bacterium]|nr:hypothetical protein [Candidatus Crickella equi]
MILFKLLLIILLSAPVIGAAAFFFYQSRNYSVKLNREEKRQEMNRDDYRPFM